MTPEEIAAQNAKIAALETQVRTLTEANTTLEKSVNEFKAKEAAVTKRAAIVAKIDAAGIPAELKTEIFIESCMLLSDDKLDLMIADRKKSVPQKKTSSRETKLEESNGRSITTPNGDKTLTVADFKKNWNKN